MAWLAVDKDNTAYLYRTKPYREGEQHDEGMEGVFGEEVGSVQRYSDYLYIGAEQAAYFGGVAAGYSCI